MKKVSEASCFHMVERDLMAPNTGEKRSIRYMRGGKTLRAQFYGKLIGSEAKYPQNVVELKKKKKKANFSMVV